MIFLPAEKRIVMASALVTAQEIYTAWVDWVVQSDHVKYPQAMRCFGGDDTEPGRRAPQFYFLMHGWKCRPMETDHLLKVTGYLYSDDMSEPFVNAIGVYKIRIVYEKPAIAVAFSDAGTPAPTVAEIITGMIAAGFGTGGLTQTQNDQLMTKIATKNDLFAL